MFEPPLGSAPADSCRTSPTFASSSLSTVRTHTGGREGGGGSSLPEQRCKRCGSMLVRRSWSDRRRARDSVNAVPGVRLVSRRTGRRSEELSRPFGWDPRRAGRRNAGPTFASSRDANEVVNEPGAGGQGRGWRTRRRTRRWDGDGE